MTDSPQVQAEDAWSPFARPPWRDCSAAAGALLRALALDSCSLVDLTEDRYTSLRAANPQLGLPRTTTITRACGSWASAVEQAAAVAAAELRTSKLAS